MESEVGWEKWGGEHVPGVQAPSPSWDGVSSPVLWQQPLHLALCPPSCLLPIPAWACRGVTELSAPSPSIGSPIFDPCLNSICFPKCHLFISTTPTACTFAEGREHILWPCHQLPGRQAVLLVVVLPSPCVQHLETLSPLPLQPPFSLSTWTNLSLALKTFLDC